MCSLLTSEPFIDSKVQLVVSKATKTDTALDFYRMSGIVNLIRKFMLAGLTDTVIVARIQCNKVVILGIMH